MKRFGWLVSVWLVGALGSSACAPGLKAGEGEGGDPNGDGTGAMGTGANASSAGGGGAMEGVGGGDDSESGGGPSNAGGSDDPGTGGDFGSGGIVDLGPPGKPGHAVVAGGTLMRSTNYMMVTTTGEAPGGNALLRSSRYRLVAGVVATSE